MLKPAIPKYKTVGSKTTGFAVVDWGGATEYDLLETREEADSIRDVLNDGIGPEWDDVREELERRGKHYPPCCPGAL